MLRRITLITTIALAAAFTFHGAQNADPGRVALENAKKIEVIDGNLDAAIKQYNQILSTYRSQRPVVAEALFRLAEAYRKLGDVRYRETYQRILLDYADQKDWYVQAQTRIGEPVFPGEVYQLTWVDRTGRVVETIGPVGFYRGVELSPDETRIAGVRQTRNGGPDIWIGSPRSGLDARFTTEGQSWMPIWSPDGRRIVFSSHRKGKWGLYVKPATGGTEELLLESEIYKAPLSWSADGRFIVYWLDEQSSDRRRGTSWILPLAGNRQPFPLIANSEISNHTNGGSQISPDGRWIAYQSRESGNVEVYIKPFPSGSGKWKVSVSGGHYPRWRGDGSELYYISWSLDSKPKQMMAVDIRGTETSIQAGTPRVLFAAEYVDYHGNVGNWHAYAVSRDGQRFLIPRFNISGTWKAKAGSLSWTLAVRQDGQRLTGAIQGCGASPVPIFDGAVEGERISFNCRSAEGVVIVYTGVNRGNAGIDFTWVPQSGGGVVYGERNLPPRKFTADRISDGTEPEIEAMARSTR